MSLHTPRQVAWAALLCRAVLSLAAPAVLPSGCQKQHPRKTDAGVPARARIINVQQELLAGASAFGALGDIRLDNGKVVAVVAQVERAVGFAATGGNLIDLALLPDGEDQLNQIFLYLGDEFPRQARYDSLGIVQDGSGGDAAIVRASGVDTKDPRIRVETDYVLEPGATWITLRSRFTSTSSAAIRGYAIGDAVQWGRAEHMAPGEGFDLPGRRVKVDWVAGIGQQTSYALVPDGKRSLDTPSGSVWSDPVGMIADLIPNQPVTYTRHLVVGRGDTASLQPMIARFRGEPTGRITGQVRTDREPVADAVVRVLDPKGGIVGLARVGASGEYAIDVPPAKYTALAFAPGRELAPPIGSPDPFVVAKGETTSKSFNLGPRASISWKVDADDGPAPPVRVTIEGVGGTPSPHLGPVFRAQGARNVHLSPHGAGELAVGAGRYRVIVSRGPEYEILDQTVDVTAGGQPEVKGTLRRTVKTPGFLSADLHQHAGPSFDSGVSLADRALSNATEGLDVLVSTDHNVLTDFRPTIEGLGLARTLASIVGVEATTHSVGHFNGVPLRVVPDHPRGGMVDPEGMSPTQIFDVLRKLAEPGAEVFIQANHPRQPGNGYFFLLGFDGATGRARDPRFVPNLGGLEVVNFGHAQDTEAVLRDWFTLIKNGHRVTATGTSDTHTIFGREVGWARTLVCADDDDPAKLDPNAFASALVAGCVTVSAGPFLTIASGTTRMGGLLAARDGRVTIEVEVQAPSWIATDRLRVYVDGEVVKTVPIPAKKEPMRLRDKVAVTCKSDCFVLARVDGDRSMAPIVSSAGGRDPRPIALTNPIYVDVDGDGRFLGGE